MWLQTPSPKRNKWRIAACMLAAALVILLGTCAVLVGSGWRLYRLERPSAGEAKAAATASAEKWSPPLGPGENAASRVKRLAHELASLSIAQTNRPNPNNVHDEAHALAGQGRYEEALQRHIWYHNHALQYDSGQSGVRISFALSYWIELGRKFPKARQALIEIRDRGDRELAEGRGDFALFMEVSAINKNLQQEDDTVRAFKGILKQDPALAKQCYFAAEDLLVEKREYELCLNLMPEAQAHFDTLRQERDRRSQMRYPTPQMGATLQKVSEDYFVTKVRNMVEILVAAGRKEEAEKICSQAVTIIDDPRLTSAIANAELRVGR